MPIEEVLCPSHKTHVDWKATSTARSTLDPGGAKGGNRDYILRYRLQGKQVETGLLLYPSPSGEDENFFLLMVQPPQRVALGRSRRASTSSCSTCPAPCTASRSTRPRC